MAKQLHIRIPQPCHENWNEMTPTTQGAFCKSCRKNVIDFSTKTENEIYNIISGAEDGKLCGRFTSFQLEQPIRKTEIKNGWMNWRAIAASLAAFFSFGKLGTSADLEPKPKLCTEKTIKGDTTVLPNKMITEQLIVGRMRRPVEETALQTLRGRVIDGSTKEPISFANIIIKHRQIGTTTDTNGYFLFNNSAWNSSKDTLVVNCIGYRSKEFPLSQFKNDSVILMEIEERMIMGMMVEVATIKRSDFADRENLLDRYDPKLDIRKKVRERAKKHF
jgi:hypothetical protein